MKSLRCGIIGCGNIAWRYQVNAEALGHYTHREAYEACPDTVLSGICDIDSVALAEAEKACPESESYASVEALINDGPWDVLSVCTPEATHAEIVRSLLESRAARVVILEKPLADTLQAAQGIVADVHASDIPVIVNYSRRFDPKYRLLKSRSESGELGSVLRAVFYYSRNLITNGSHALDLLRYIWGPLTIEHVIAPKNAAAQECLVDVHGCFGNGAPFSLLGMPAAHYYLFEGDVFCEQRSFRFRDCGTRIVECEPLPSPWVGGQQALHEVHTHEETANATLHAVEEAVRLLSNPATPLTCSVEDALETSRLLDTLLNLAKPHA